MYRGGTWIPKGCADVSIQSKQSKHLCCLSTDLREWATFLDKVLKATTAVFCQTTYYSSLKKKVATLRLCLRLLMFFVKKCWEEAIWKAIFKCSNKRQQCAEKELYIWDVTKAISERAHEIVDDERLRESWRSRLLFQQKGALWLFRSASPIKLGQLKRLKNNENKRKKGLQPDDIQLTGSKLIAEW